MTQKNKIVISFLTGFILVIMLFRLGTFRNSQNDFLQILNKVIIGDEMKVRSGIDIDKNKIKINLAVSEKKVYEQNHFLDNIGEQYGGPFFDIYYDNQIIGQALNYNTNDWYTNEFVFDFYKEANRIKFKFKTNGRDNSGADGYIYIEKINDSLSYESYDTKGKLINKWKG